MFQLSATFIASFKLGDNIHYNLAVLRTLYLHQRDANIVHKPHFEKPISLLLVSVAEALVYDFIQRSVLAKGFQESLSMVWRS